MPDRRPSRFSEPLPDKARTASELALRKDVIDRLRKLRHRSAAKNDRFPFSEELQREDRSR